MIAIDNSPIRLACAKHNAEIYGVADRITFILGDFIQWSQNYVERKSRGEVKKEEEVEVVFLSPPWGGIKYKTAGIPGKSRESKVPLSYPLSALGPIHGAELFGIARSISHNVAYYLPKNTDLTEISNLPLTYPMTGSKGEELGGRVEKIEVEEEWMGNKLKAVVCYFGELAHEWKD